LRGLASSARYDLTVNGERRGSVSGASLARDGLLVALDAEWRATIIELDASGSGR
jgi:hypothetical protein